MGDPLIPWTSMKFENHKFDFEENVISILIGTTNLVSSKPIVVWYDIQLKEIQTFK